MIHLYPIALRIIIGICLTFIANSQRSDDDYYTIIFISDLENMYRMHSVDRSRYVVGYVRDLGDKNLHFDTPYRDVRVNTPALVIHGGDISHMWSNGERSPTNEFNDIWNLLYDNGIPMISSFGNHDWANNAGDAIDSANVHGEQYNGNIEYVNNASSEFVQSTYEKSMQLGDFQFEEFTPDGEYGQSMYRSILRNNLQIVSFNCRADWKSYDDISSSGIRGSNNLSAQRQLNNLTESLDTNMNTLFFSHYPIANIPSTSTPNKREVMNIIGEIPGSHHFSGHAHMERHDNYGTFVDHVAPYPHGWYGAQPGVFAILVSAATGAILQIKTINIDGYEDGHVCADASDFLDSDLNYGLHTDECAPCKAGYAAFRLETADFRCGCIPDGARCYDSINCNECCNGSKYYSSKFTKACGSSCFGSGAKCSKISCNEDCCSGTSTCEWSWDWSNIGWNCYCQ